MASKDNPTEHNYNLLIIDDDKKFCRMLVDYLTPLGYDVTCAHNGPDGLESALEGQWAAIILDVMLPGFDGIELLRRLRRKSDVPVLMLTGRGDETDRIVGLEVGADDYLSKTFSTRELLARLRAVNRRFIRSAIKNDDNSLQDFRIGSIVFRPNKRLVLQNDTPLILTPVEYDLLYLLAKSRGRIKSRDQLLEQIRDRDYEIFDRSIDVHISSLRKKLGDDLKSPKYIQTVRSVGYMFINPDE